MNPGHQTLEPLHCPLSAPDWPQTPKAPSRGSQAASRTLQQDRKQLGKFSLQLLPFHLAGLGIWRESPFIEEVYAFNSLSLSKPVVQQDLGAVNNSVWLRDFHCFAAAGSVPTGPTLASAPPYWGTPFLWPFVLSPHSTASLCSPSSKPPGTNFNLSGGTEAQRGEGCCPRPHSRQET